MRIKHKERNSFYEITEAQGKYTLIDSTTTTEYRFSELYDAVWKVIELIRSASFSDLSHDDVVKLTTPFGATVSNPKNLLCVLVDVEINRTYYDRVFIKLIASFRMIADEVVISNKTNFIIEEEIAYILRKKSGISFQIPVSRREILDRYR